jgi:hypothetical protein
MRKIVWLAILAVAGVYGTGYFSLGESGARSFLDQVESLTVNGKAEELCDLLTDDATFAMNDHTAGRAGEASGNKQDLCELYQAIAPAMMLMRTQMQVERRGFTVKRDWLLHPWTADVSYTEFRTMSIPRAGVKIETESDDKLTLVRTLSGVKIRRVESETFAAEAG